MASWGVSHFTAKRAEGLVRKGLLCERTAGDEWRLPETEQHIAAFVALCEGFLGIEPHFELWKYFFAVSLYQKTGKAGGQHQSPPVPIGASPRGVSPRLAPKKVLRSSSSSGGRAAAPPAATGGVPGVAAGLPAEVAAAAGSAAGGGADPTPPAAPPVVLPAQAAIPPGSQAGEVIDLDADEAEDAETTVGGADAPADVARSEAEGALVPEGAAVVEVPMSEGEVSVPAAPTGVLPAAEADVPIEVPSAAVVATGVQAPESSVDPGISGVVMSSSATTSESGPVPPSASSVPGAWRGHILRWSSRDDPLRRLYALDNAAEWHKWQVVHGGVARAQAALTSALEALADTVVPGNQALQEASLEKSNFLRRQRKLWEHYIAEREHSRGLALQLGAAQGAAAMDKARHDAEGLRAAATERACRDAKELARLRGENAALRAERDQFRLQVDGLQTAVSLSVAREHELKAKADEDLAKLQASLVEERGEHGALRDAVRVVCEDFGVAPEEGSSSLPTRVLEGYCVGYTDAELDEIDSAVTAPAEALAKLLEDEAVPPAAPEANPAGPEAPAAADPEAVAVADPGTTAPADPPVN
nr:uncharacterized protein LOC117864613 [Setaria viridis]